MKHVFQPAGHPSQQGLLCCLLKACLHMHQLLLIRATTKPHALRGAVLRCAGSLVLQLPTAEACHVACQLHTGGSEHLWSHVRARQSRKGTSCALPQPAVGTPLVQSDLGCTASPVLLCH